MAENHPGYAYVRSALTDRRGDAVAAHEIDEQHPGGSVLVAGDMVRKVALTPFIKSRLREGWLEEARGDRKEADEWAADMVKSNPAPRGGRDEPGQGSQPTEAEIAADKANKDPYVVAGDNRVPEPVKGAGDYVDDGSDKAVDEMTVAELRAYAAERQIELPDGPKADLVAAIREHEAAQPKG